MQRLLTAVAWLLLALQVLSQDTSNDARTNFNPTAHAYCQGKQMVITLATEQPFSGILHTRDTERAYRDPPCSVIGNRTRSVTLTLNALALPGSPDYCGITVDKKTQVKRVLVAARSHKTFELANDKIFKLSCTEGNYRNARSELSTVTLKFLDDGKETTELYQGRQYTLRAQTSKPDGINVVRVSNCKAFSTMNMTDVQLTDSSGCPVSPIISKFTNNLAGGYADAIVFSMFKYPNDRRLTVECDIETCSGTCPEESCPEGVRPQPRTTSPTSGGENNLLASTTVFVLEPGETSPDALPLTDCTIHRWSWLLGLCIAFGVLFLIMLIINIFLCSALTCTCTRQEIIEKEPSVIEEYDPYKATWVGSQYGSRYSLNGKPGYTSGGSTLNSTTRSVSTNSDHYAIVHSHPGSRYSTHGSTKGGGHGSTMSNGGQYNHAYSGRM